MSAGRVTLVGAGPGDPELLTVRGARRLAEADLVLYDALSSEAMRELAPGARWFYVGKRACRNSIDQDVLNRLMIKHALRGRHVVRLKCGDPFVFGRGGEEVLALGEAGIPVEVVPGLSTAIAAPALAGIPVTHRGLASSFAVITGHHEQTYGPLLDGFPPRGAHAGRADGRSPARVDRGAPDRARLVGVDAGGAGDGRRDRQGVALDRAARRARRGRDPGRRQRTRRGCWSSATWCRWPIGSRRAVRRIRRRPIVGPGSSDLRDLRVRAGGGVVMSLVVRNLTKRFTTRGTPAVADVSFAAPTGGITTLLGPSGSGKSTVLRMVAGLEQPDSGTVVFGDRDFTTVPAQRRGIGFVFQSYALFKHMNVRKNIAFGLRVRKMPAEQMSARVDELLALVQLEGLGERYPGQLSGGQRQRVAFARALAISPQLLLLDEPFGALDAQVRLELREWLRRFHDKRHVTTLLVTHDQEEAMEVSDHVVVMHEGRVAQVGQPQEVYDRPATPFVASFVGGANVLHGHMREGRASVGTAPASARSRCPCPTARRRPTAPRSTPSCARTTSR